MKEAKKEILIELLVVLLIVSLFALTRVNTSIKYRWDDISIFEPFSKNNALINEKQDLIIKDDLPKMEAASAFYPFAAGFVQNTYSEDSFSKEFLKMVSTTEGYLDIINGKIDILIASGPSDEQKKMIEDSEADLVFKSIYLEPLIILVNKESEVNNLSMDEIKDIYYSNDSKWNTYQLEKNNGSQTCFESFVKNNKLGNNHYEIKSMNEIVDKIATDKKAIGYAFNSYYSKMHNNKKAKRISVNDINYRDENYPLLFEVYFIYRADNSNSNIPSIVKWFDTNEGQEFIEKIK